MHYIDTLGEYSERIDERRKPKLSKKTGNKVASILGKNEKAGREIFKTINENVEKLETIIDEYNKKHKVSLKKSPLEVKIDKTKLDIQYLISLTKLKKTPFIADVIVANILNYKILIRPIKNARIIALAYRYYLAMVRHTLQTSLIMIELSADTFFSQINANLVGRKKQMKEMLDRIVTSTRENMANFFMGQSLMDKKGNQRTVKEVLDPKQFDQINKLIKNLNTMTRSNNEYDRISGYNQNVFQDSGRTLESLVKANQDKELQALAEQFNNIANSTTGFSKDDKADAREQVANYAAAVKLSTERRAMEVCVQINMNMFDIMKMFSIRNIDGFSEAFEESAEIDKYEEEHNKQLEAYALAEQERESSFETKVNKRVEELTKQVKDEYKDKQLFHWKNKGFEELMSPADLKKMVYDGNPNFTKTLKDSGFTDTQIYEILQRRDKITDYEKIYYGDLEEYLIGKEDHKISINGKDYKLDDIKDEDDDKLFGWMRKDSNKYKNIKGLNKSSEEEKRREEYKKKHKDIE